MTQHGLGTGRIIMRKLWIVTWCCVSGLSALVSPRTAAAQGAIADHQYSTADVEAGSRLYANQCALCHGPNGDLIAGINLRHGVFRRSVSDEDIARVISTGIANTAMPSFNLQPAEINTLIAFIRAGFDLGSAVVKLGDPARGQALFEGKAGCSTCHRVNGVGPRTAPDLSDIGAIRPPAAIQRSLLDPSSAMIPINRPVRLVTQDGKTYRGRRLNEDTFTVQVIDDQERLMTFTKADLREYELGKTSPMPPATALSGDELADLIGYLLTLKGKP
jgi:putative heme-binding domain-containing protein